MIEDTLRLSKHGRKISKEIGNIYLLEDLETLEERLRKYTDLIHDRYIELSEKFTEERIGEASRKVITRGDYDLMNVLGVGYGKMDAALYSLKSVIEEYKLFRDKISKYEKYPINMMKEDEYEKKEEYEKKSAKQEKNT